jgi:hypothetical protein
MRQCYELILGVVCVFCAVYCACFEWLVRMSAAWDVWGMGTFLVTAVHMLFDPHPLSKSRHASRHACMLVNEKSRRTSLPHPCCPVSHVI